MEVKAGAILAEAAATYNERNAVYGDNYKRVGLAMQALFPNGVSLNGNDSFNRWHILELMVVKLSRYAVAMERGGSHQDSLRDLAVYTAILEEIDTNLGFFDPLPVVEPVKAPILPEGYLPVGQDGIVFPTPDTHEPIQPQTIHGEVTFVGSKGTECSMTLAEPDVPSEEPIAEEPRIVEGEAHHV